MFIIFSLESPNLWIPTPQSSRRTWRSLSSGQRGDESSNQNDRDATPSADELRSPEFGLM